MTIAIILSAHGSVANQLLKTAEMIAGPQKNIACVDLLPEENTEILIEKYNTHLLHLNIDSGVLFLVDIWGGSPFNAANHIASNKENFDVITGINIPMLIEIFITRDNINTCNKLITVALKSGYESIKSLKNSSNDHNLAKKINKSATVTTPIQNNNTTNTNTLISSSHNLSNKKNHMHISLTRIDDRLIHGQVVTRWAKEYKIQRILVINDNVAQDTLRKTLLTQVTPPGITAHVLDIDKAIRVYNNPKYAKDKVILLFTNPTDVLRVIQGGIPINTVNIGGMAFCQGKKQINNAISVDATDIAAFKKLNHYGVTLEIRKVPSDPKLNIMKLIHNISNI